MATKSTSAAVAPAPQTKAEAFAVEFDITITQAMRHIEELSKHSRGEISDWDLYSRTEIYKGDDKPLRPATEEEITDWRHQRLESVMKAKRMKYDHDRAREMQVAARFERYLTEAGVPLEDPDDLRRLFEERLSALKQSPVETATVLGVACLQAGYPVSIVISEEGFSLHTVTSAVEVTYKQLAEEGQEAVVSRLVSAWQVQADGGPRIYHGLGDAVTEYIVRDQQGIYERTNNILIASWDADKQQFISISGQVVTWETDESGERNRIQFS